MGSCKKGEDFVWKWICFDCTMFYLQFLLSLSLNIVADITCVQHGISVKGKPQTLYCTKRTIILKTYTHIHIQTVSLSITSNRKVFLPCVPVFFVSKDMTSDHHRGKVFGQMQAAFMSGMFCATMVAGNLANLYVWRIPGWRIVFFLGSSAVFLFFEGSRSRNEVVYIDEDHCMGLEWFPTASPTCFYCRSFYRPTQFTLPCHER